ncbi:MAG: OmpA family protein [bacterium]|nr:OmpA family protein [bacterium]
MLSCKSSHKLGQEFDLRDSTERKTEFRFTQTRHIDSVDIKKLMVDVWKLEHYSYPDSIRMFVRVLDSTGNIVTHMAQPYVKAGAPNYFTRLEEHLGTGRFRKNAVVEKFTVREFSEQDSIPTYIALALDYSGSMKPVKDAIEAGTELFVGMKRDCDLISITGFHKEATVVSPLSRSGNDILRSYRDYSKRTQGLFSASMDGIMKSLHTLDSVPISEPKVAIVFADGDENSSQLKVQDIIEYGVKNNVSVYCIGFGYANDETLQALSLYTGGKYYRAYSKQDLKQIFVDIYRSLRNYYLVRYVPPQYNGLHVVDVTVNVPGRDTLVARGQYEKNPIDTNFRTTEFTRPILFAYNSSVIDTSSFHIIDEIADAMTRNPRIVLEVQGHTDNIGDEAFNINLSTARAEAVRDALIARNIGTSSLRTRAFGFSMPVAPNDTEENRARNRRTVFKILRK